MLLAAPAPGPPVAVGVALREFRITLYRTSVPPGRLRLNLRNLGEDGHDLAVRRDGRTLARTPVLRAGRSVTLRLLVRRPGRLRLVCTLADHEARGMRATLRVRR